MLLLLASVLLMRVKAMTNVDLNDIVSLTALCLFLILGDITIVPDISFRMQLKVISQPSDADMIEFMRSGEQAAFPSISRIQNTMVLER
jgi:hypothetical protein